MKRTIRTRNLGRTRSEILAASFVEIFEHGYGAASIERILSKTNLTKGALFHQFPSKLALGYALVEEVISPMIIERWITPVQNYANPLEGILVQMQKLIGDVPSEQLRLGCPLNNLVQEMSARDAGFKIRLQAALNLWIGETDLLLRRAKKNGLIREDAHTLEAARFVVMTHEGFFGLMKGLGDAALFPAAYNSLKSYFLSLV